jgi:hypothetical protein
MKRRRLTAYRAPQIVNEILDMLEDWEGNIKSAPRKIQQRMHNLLSQIDDKKDLRYIENYLKLLNPKDHMSPEMKRELQRTFGSRRHRTV